MRVCKGIWSGGDKILHLLTPGRGEFWFGFLTQGDDRSQVSHLNIYESGYICEVHIFAVASGGDGRYKSEMTEEKKKSE